jgi:uncharacterized protein YodC (DUF2158 family)
VSSEAGFERGDVVRLRGGGVPMTVEKPGRWATRCVWFEGATLHRDEFATEALEPCEAPGDGPASGGSAAEG